MGKDAIRRIATSPALIAEAKAVTQQLDDRQVAMGRTAVLERMIRLAPIFGFTNRKPGEWAELFTAYMDSLETLPAEALELAIVDWNRAKLYPNDPKRCAFFPKPAELFKLAEPYSIKMRLAAWRAGQAIDWREKNPPPRTAAERKADREEAIRLGYMNPDGSMNLRPKGIPPAARPQPGVTPQMLADRVRALAESPPERQAISQDEEAIG